MSQVLLGNKLALIDRAMYLSIYCMVQHTGPAVDSDSINLKGEKNIILLDEKHQAKCYFVCVK